MWPKTGSTIAARAGSCVEMRTQWNHPPDPRDPSDGKAAATAHVPMADGQAHRAVPAPVDPGPAGPVTAAGGETAAGDEMAAGDETPAGRQTAAGHAASP